MRETNHTMDYDCFFKKHLAARNHLCMRRKFDHVTLKSMRQRNSSTPPCGMEEDEKYHAFALFRGRRIEVKGFIGGVH